MLERSKKNKLCMLISLMLFLNIFLCLLIGIERDSYNIILRIKNVTRDYQESLLKNTIKPHQETILNQIKQSFINYIGKNNKEIFKNNEWDRDSLKDALNVVAAPVKVFGNKGGIVVFDSRNGEVFLDTTFHNREGKNIKDDKVSKEEMRKMLERKDTVSVSGIIYNPFKEDIRDLTDYKNAPLGLHNREFIEKIILPFESMEFKKGKQLTLLVVANEKDIFNEYIDDIEKTNSEVIGLEDNVKTAVIYTALMLVVTILASVYLLCKYTKR